MPRGWCSKEGKEGGEKVGASGNVVSTTLYKPWGETRYSSGAASTDYKYTGQLQVDIGIYYYGARFYDP